MIKIYLVMSGREYEDHHIVKAFLDRQKAFEYALKLKEQQDKEDEEEDTDSGYCFFLKTVWCEK